VSEHVQASFVPRDSLPPLVREPSVNAVNWVDLCHPLVTLETDLRGVRRVRWSDDSVCPTCAARVQWALDAMPQPGDDVTNTETYPQSEPEYTRAGTAPARADDSNVSEWEAIAPGQTQAETVILLEARRDRPVTWLDGRESA
jgi:hypothetical protein